MEGQIDPMQGGSLDGTMSDATPGFVKKKKTYDPKRRAIMMQILNDGTDPNELRKIHVMHGYDEDEVNDAIATYQRITSGQTQPEETGAANAKDYANAIRNKQITLNDVPEEGKDQVIKELSGLGPAEDAKTAKDKENKMNTVPVIEDKIKQIDDLKDDWYLDAAVGPNFATRTSMLNWATGGKDEFIGKVQQILDQETLDKLIEIKGEGATLGALSDSEREMLKRAASPISQWAIKDGDGKVVGYDINEKAFKEELDRLKKNAERRKENTIKSGGNPNEGITSSGLKYVIE